MPRSVRDVLRLSREPSIQRLLLASCIGLLGTSVGAYPPAQTAESRERCVTLECRRQASEEAGAAVSAAHAVDTPTTRLDLAQLKARLKAATGDTPPDLRQVDLSGLDLSGLDFKRANLTGARLAGTKLAGANLFSCDLTDAVASDAVLTRANMDGTVLRRADFQRANLTNASLFATIIEAADLSDANLSGAR